MIDDEGVDLEEEDVADLNDLMNETEAVKARNHFQSIFWNQQSKYNELDDKRRMRWHPLMIRFALNLKYLSSFAYTAVSNVLALPSKRTLCDYTHIMSVNAGINCKVEMRYEF